jgi:hypothetical protein
MRVVRELERQLNNVIFPLFETRDYLKRCKDGGVDFIIFLEDNCHRIASRDHDKFYGLLGLTSPLVQKLIVPDYGLDIATVYAQPVVVEMQTVASLRPLLSSRNNDTKFELPSWVPDWSFFSRNGLTDEYSVQSRRGLCVKTGQLRVEFIALKVV